MSGSYARGFLAVVETLRISVPTVADALRGRLTRQACDRRLRDWGQRMIGNAAIELEVHGLEHARAHEPMVLMSNHQSHYDVPVLFETFSRSGRSMRMVAKTELYKVPVFGRALRAAEFIEVDRSNRERARASIDVAKQRLASGVDVWIAPEGTRSTSGKLGAFKRGGFVLARDTGAKILPITIDGTRHVLPPHSGQVDRGHRVRVTYHPLVDPSAHGKEELISEVRRVIASALPEEKA